MVFFNFLWFKKILKFAADLYIHVTWIKSKFYCHSWLLWKEALKHSYIFVYFETLKIYNFSSCMSFNADIKKKTLIIYSKTFCCDISPTRKMFFLAEKYVFFISICKRVTRKICLTCDWNKQDLTRHHGVSV